jgi:hypothetical protein
MEKLTMKNLKMMFAFVFVFGCLGVSQIFACQFPATESLKNGAASQVLLPRDISNDLIIRVESDQSSFSKRDLNGRYASFAQATFFDPSQNRTTYATCVGVVTFDGRGRFTDREVHSYDGVIVRDQFTGTYTVNADGSGVMHFVGENESYDYDIVLSNGGKDVIFLVELPVPGLVSQGTLKKQ